MNSDQIAASIRSGYRHLDRAQAFQHYKYAVLILAAGGAISLILLGEFDISWGAFITWNAVFVVMAMVVLLLQRLRLKMEVVETNLSQKQLNAILRTVGKSRGWVRYRGIKECYVARIPRPQDMQGETVTVLFGKNKVFINSIPEPKGNLSISAYRRCRKSTHILKRVIRNRRTGH
jgi:hypothetical protein